MEIVKAFRSLNFPLSKITERFNPRVVIKLWRFGDMNKPSHEFLSSDFLWLCCSCYNCQERCPQKIPVTEVMHWFRNLAVKRSYIPNIYSEFASALLNDARLVKVSQFAEKKRTRLGLPPFQPTGVDALRKILSATDSTSCRIKQKHGEKNLLCLALSSQLVNFIHARTFYCDVKKLIPKVYTEP